MDVLLFRSLQNGQTEEAGQEAAGEGVDRLREQRAEPGPLGAWGGGGGA